MDVSRSGVLLSVNLEAQTLPTPHHTGRTGIGKHPVSWPVAVCDPWLGVRQASAGRRRACSYQRRGSTVRVQVKINSAVSPQVGAMRIGAARAGGSLVARVE